MQSTHKQKKSLVSFWGRTWYEYCSLIPTVFVINFDDQIQGCYIYSRQVLIWDDEEPGENKAAADKEAVQDVCVIASWKVQTWIFMHTECTLIWSELGGKKNCRSVKLCFTAISKYTCLYCKMVKIVEPESVDHTGTSVLHQLQRQKMS